MPLSFFYLSQSLLQCITIRLKSIAMMTRRQLQVRPPTRVFSAEHIHPSECRFFPYLQDMAILNRLNGFDGPENQQISTLQNLVGQYPSEHSVNRWTERHLQFDHCRTFRRTGNHHAQREVVDPNLVILAFYKAVLPKSTIYETIAFLYNMNCHDPDNHLYSCSQICRAASSLYITKKRFNYCCASHGIYKYSNPSYSSLNLGDNTVGNLKEEAIY